MPQLFPLLLADLDAIIKAIILIVFLASGAVRLFTESKNSQKRVERQPQRPRPRPAPADGGDAAEARGAAVRQTPQEAIRSEVDEFLRRAKQTSGDSPDQPAQRPQRRQSQREEQIELIEDETGFEVDQRPRQSQRRRRRRPEQPVQVQLEPDEGIERGDTVAEHVAEHLQRGEFAARASQLGEEVAQSDDRLEARLTQKFDHSLGSLSARRQAREAADAEKKDLADAPSLADNLVEMLSTPQGVQQAVLLSEVLGRPADRW